MGLDWDVVGGCNQSRVDITGRLEARGKGRGYHEQQTKRCRGKYQ